ncbi:Tripartite-type tricarboxylate transporter, receptor component TctC [Polaromonas sp. OV174]|uniref:Bug family tripartite tricarboxylate transporter substrate binding protein n=1 Tax=Polaromonas sp. OV174 TaxID=1855300 RepID=UPI0008DEAFD5|nr:tripartite tricarboxylate transporter substrate binding protein [Polaromonas sp. OV174]SFB89562.1 Tripartite-type tricarboxylate transporter, receptor component TctC [Polaromonas sp. OV174]
MKIASKFEKLGVLVACALCFASSQSAAQTWPAKEITLLVPGAPGGSSDLPARLMAERMSKDLGQPIIIKNRPSASSIVAMGALKEAKADGYTLGFMPGSAFIVAPWTSSVTLPYDVIRDFTPIGMAVYTPLAIAVSAASPYKTMRDLLDAAKAKPDTLVVANPGANTLADLGTRLISSNAKAPLRSIAFSGFPQSYPAVVRGDAAAVIDGVSPMLPHVEAGTLRILSVGSQTKLPGLESFALLNDAVAGVAIEGWFGVFAPAGLPDDMSKKISESVQRAMRDDTLVARLKGWGMYPRQDSPESFKQYVKQEHDKWGKIVRASNVGAPSK